MKLSHIISLAESYPFKPFPLIREAGDLRENHDYDPSWDYEIDDNPDPEYVKLVNETVGEIKSRILPEFGDIKTITTSYILDNDDDTLARYINGTKSDAHFVIDVPNLKEAIKQYPVDPKTAVESTLVHELAHAIQDILEADMDEDEAEDFAFGYTYGKIDPFWEKYI